jgi:hypothetical protein
VNAQQRTDWNNRPTQVKVFELCESCDTLKEGVETREETGYWPSFHVKLKSCACCFDVAKNKARVEASQVAYC